MPGGTVTCRRCGAANPAGDQFCGSCGAFLEWEGDATEAASATGAPSATEAPHASGAPATPPPESPALPPASITATAPASAMVACPSCGTLNPTQKVFCQSCGTDLRDVARADGPAGTARAGARSDAAAGSSGLPFWLPIVLVIGLVAGVGLVVAGIVMRPAPVPPGATTAASATFTPTLPPSGATSPSANASVQLTPLDAKASSVVGNRAKFKADNVIDGDLETCWQEGAAEEKGQWIEVSFAPSTVDYVVIYSGYQLSGDTFHGNRRPENVLVTVNGGTPAAFILADSEQPQRLDLDDTPGATAVRIEIDSSFDAVKTQYKGSPFDDVAITEIRVFGRAP